MLNKIAEEGKEKKGKDIFTEAMESSVANTAANITGTADFLIGKPLESLGWEDNFISEWNSYYQDKAEEKHQDVMEAAARTGKGKTAEITGEILTFLGEAGIDAVLSVFTGGASAAAKLGSKGGKVLKYADDVGDLARSKKYFNSNTDALNKADDFYEKWYKTHKEDFGENAPETFADFKKKLYNSGESKKINEIKNQIDTLQKAKCELTQSKITNFLLKTGQKHAEDFFAVGYTKNDSLFLKYDIARQFDIKKAVDIRPGKNELETTFSIFMELGVNKKKSFRTVWKIDKPGNVPRIITSHREDI